MNFTYHIFRPGEPENAFAGFALDEYLKTESPEENYSQMMRYRLQGKASQVCDDTYFIALDPGASDLAVSRIWYGFGRHDGKVGNFGNFMTDERYRRQGIGRKLLDMLISDLHARKKEDLPLALFCSAGKRMVKLYEDTLGFRPALPGAECGPLYCPLGESPGTFAAFEEKYYAPAGVLRIVPGNAEYRHEIDCLLNFALQCHGEKLGLPGAPSCESAVLNPQAGKLEFVLDSATGHCAGWAFTPAGGKRTFQLHFAYRNQTEGL